MPSNKPKNIDESIEPEESGSKPECFVIMPFSDPDGYESGHFKRVYEDIFTPAIEKAGFKPFRSDDSSAASLIQLEILKKLLDCPMALCDLSSRNPNVLFELGIRQAFDKPVALVQECGTPRIFDISQINTVDYRKERIYHEVLEDQHKISKAIRETFESCKNGKAVNSIVKLLSISQPAKIEDIEQVKQDPALQYIMAEISGLRSDLRNLRNNTRDNSTTINEKDISYNAQYKILLSTYLSLENLLSKNPAQINLFELMDLILQCESIYKQTTEPIFRELSNNFRRLSHKYIEFIKKDDVV